jgi:hypothetical protein
VPEAESKPARKPVNVRRGLLISFGICMASGVLALFGLLSLALVIGIFGVLLNAVGAVHGVFTVNGGALKLHGGRGVMYFGLAVLCTALASERERHGRQLADGILSAIAAYQRDHGDYPGELYALVPRYLPKIPLAVDSPLEEFQFHYYKRKKAFNLTFHASYLNANYYESDSGKWSHAD